MEGLGPKGLGLRDLSCSRNRQESREPLKDRPRDHILTPKPYEALAP